MTDGERAIWAAAFALEVDKHISSPPSHVVHDAKKWQAWEESIISHACERAAGFVVRAREILPQVIEGFDEESETTRQLRTMLGVKKEPSGDADL